MKGKRILALGLVSVMCLTACSPKVDMRSAKGRNKSCEASDIEKVTKRDKDVSDGSVQYGNGEDLELEELKTKYDSLSNSKVYSPMYNVDLDSSFTFHFKSKVDPYQAVTVHTSDKCNLDSRMYIENTAYLTSDGGVDVVVNGTGDLDDEALRNPILECEDRLDYGIKNIWGNAQQYYISINYDLDSETPVKLDEPLIIPFTLKKDVVSPILSYKISKDGDFVLSWEDVEADSYRIYKAHTLFIDENYIAKDRAYYSLRYEFDREVSGNTLECILNDIENEYKPNYGQFVNYFYCITAVKDGKESSFSNEVTPSKMLSMIPYEIYENDVLLTSTYSDPLKELPYTVNVLMADKETIKSYPVNYTLSYDEYADSLNKVTYDYEVVGTRLKWHIDLQVNGKDQYEKEIKSPILLDYTMSSNNINPISVNNEDATVINGIDAGEIDLTKIKKYNPHTRVKMLTNALLDKVEVECSRELTGGVHSEECIELWENPVVDYGDKVNTVDYIEKTYGKDVFIDSENTLDKYAVTADNIIQAKMKDDEKRIEEGNKIKLQVPDGIVYEADFLEEEYLAVNLINQAEKIRIDILPTLMDSSKLFDVITKVKYQNPYIMGIKNYSIEYEDGGVYLVPVYKFNKEEAKKMQQEIMVESERIIDEIITPDMTDNEKIDAIWTYLEDNTKYDHEALKNCEKYHYRNVDHEFETAYNTYGILCKKVGVCMSYAYTTDLLCKLCGVDAMVLTGYGSSGVGHAWNAINLDGNWYWFDATNTYDATLVQRFIYLTSSDFALNDIGYTLDNYYELDSRLSIPLNSSNSEDWYYTKGLVANNDEEFISCIKKGYDEATKNGDMSFAVRVNYDINVLDVNLVGKCLDELEACGMKNEQLRNVRGPLYSKPYAMIMIDEEGIMNKIKETYQQ